jgi:hypothetical protein
MEGAKITFTQILGFLEENIDKGGIVLLLGARAGGFFRSQDFYNTIRSFGNPSFRDLPRGRQFAECYRLLIGSLFTREGIDTILIASLNDVDVTDADLCLAKLVKRGVFDVIVSTNIDNLLEQALEKVGMKELHDFDVFSPKPDTIIRAERKFSRRIIKFFGELRTRDYAYTMTPEARLDSVQNLGETLKKELERNVLAIGLDPVWDREILKLLPPQGGAFWCIDEDEQDISPSLREISKTRLCRHLTGINGQYSSIMKELCGLLMEKTPSDEIQIKGTQVDTVLMENRGLIEGIHGLGSIPVILPSPETPLPAVETTLEIFISYVPEDEQLCTKLTSHLATLKNQKVIDVWHHRKIIAGEYRKNEIDRHLNSASVILLLVSADFNASDDYIHGVELERAIELHRGEKARVIPVILRPVDWKGTPFEGLAPLPSDRKPVTMWTNQDSAFLDIVNGIRDVIEGLKKKP